MLLSSILRRFRNHRPRRHAAQRRDGGNRQFIMVQLPEPCDEQSEAFKAGYKTIAEIGKERIRRAGARLKSEMGRVKSEKEANDHDSEIHTSPFTLHHS